MATKDWEPRDDKEDYLKVCKDIDELRELIFERFKANHNVELEDSHQHFFKEEVFTISIEVKDFRDNFEGEDWSGRVYGVDKDEVVINKEGNKEDNKGDLIDEAGNDQKEDNLLIRREDSDHSWGGGLVLRGVIGEELRYEDLVFVGDLVSDNSIEDSWEEKTVVMKEEDH